MVAPTVGGWQNREFVHKNRLVFAFQLPFFIAAVESSSKITAVSPIHTVLSTGPTTAYPSSGAIVSKCSPAASPASMPEPSAPLLACAAPAPTTTPVHRHRASHCHCHRGTPARLLRTQRPVLVQSTHYNSFNNRSYSS